MRILVGGVGQLYQGDLDAGRRAVEWLAGEGPAPGVVYEDLHYGAVAVAQRLEELDPHALILVGATSRDRAPGTVERVRVTEALHEAGRIQDAVRNAVTGYVDIDLVVDVGVGFGVLPPRTVVVEIEPETIEPAEELSARGEAALEEAVAVVRREILRVPALDTADRIRSSLAEDRLEPSGALAAMEELLDALDLLDREGRWGRTSAARDRLRRRIADGQTSEGMSHLDWGLWWALIEAIDRLEGQEAAAAF